MDASLSDFILSFIMRYFINISIVHRTHIFVGDSILILLTYEFVDWH
jgi:hypothetical protein